MVRRAVSSVRDINRLCDDLNAYGTDIMVTGYEPHEAGYVSPEINGHFRTLLSAISHDKSPNFKLDFELKTDNSNFRRLNKAFQNAYIARMRA